MFASQAARPEQKPSFPARISPLDVQNLDRIKDPLAETGDGYGQFSEVITLLEAIDPRFCRLPATNVVDRLSDVEGIAPLPVSVCLGLGLLLEGHCELHGLGNALLLGGLLHSRAIPTRERLQGTEILPLELTCT